MISKAVQRSFFSLLTPSEAIDWFVLDEQEKSTARFEAILHAH